MKNKIKKNKGFVLLYVIILSSVILAIALSVGNISLKEINFSTSAEKTNDAFFAADVGVECALFNDKSTNSVFTEPAPSSLSCSNRTIDLNHPSSTTWDFQFSKLNQSKKGCAKVTVNKTDPLTTYIVSKGYNEGGDSNSCQQLDTNIERQLNVQY